MSANDQATFTVFAYGSNMLTSRIRERCPSARALGIAELRGHELRWHKGSKKDGSGKCDILQSTEPNAIVYGVLFEIEVGEKSTLDYVEGLGKGYDEKEVRVSHRDTPRSAIAYFATAIDPRLKPFSWYHALVIAGAKEHGLPASYIAKLQSQPTIDDLDRLRHDTNMSLLVGAQS